MTAERVKVEPSLYMWACERSRKSVESLSDKKFPNLKSWIEGKASPTLRQLEEFANKTYTPIDYFFREEPPLPAKMPLPDMRTVGNKPVQEPSLELLEIIHLCQYRQEWYLDYLDRTSNIFCDFVGSVNTSTPVGDVAAKMRKALGLDRLPRAGSKEAMIKVLTGRAEDLGVLVMRSSMIKSHHRPLDPKEFRGFALTSDRVPLIFINSRDSNATQRFTFAHELAHIWLGSTAISGNDQLGESDQSEERWCHKVAAGLLSEDIVNSADDEYEAKFLAQEKGGGGKDTTRIRQMNAASPTLARAVITDTWQGETSFTEAFELLAVSNVNALVDIARRLGLKL